MVLVPADLVQQVAEIRRHGAGEAEADRRG
jgi:hypothetical protein